MDTSKNLFLKNKLWAIILVAQFLLFYALSKSNAAVTFFSKLFEWKKNIHNTLFSSAPVSVGDCIYIFLGIGLLILLVMGIIRRKSVYLKTILIVTNIFYFVYQSFWGMLYFQPPIINQLSKRKISESEVKALALQYLNICKSERILLREDSNGILRVLDYGVIQKEILKQQEKLPKNISKKKPVKNLDVKPSLFGNLMSETGILGYYNPFTAEAQYNPSIPSTQVPFTLAHEMAHQLGFAREQEASFIGFLCARQSGSRKLRYSANLYALKSLIRAIAIVDEPFARQIIQSYSEPMKRDRLYEQRFYEEHSGFISDFFGITNDLFLKSNQQDGSISYSYFVNLLILYHQ